MSVVEREAQLRLLHRKVRPKPLEGRAPSKLYRLPPSSPPSCFRGNIVKTASSTPRSCNARDTINETPFPLSRSSTALCQPVPSEDKPNNTASSKQLCQDGTAAKLRQVSGQREAVNEIPRPLKESSTGLCVPVASGDEPNITASSPPVSCKSEKSDLLRKGSPRPEVISEMPRLMRASDTGLHPLVSSESKRKKVVKIPMNRQLAQDAQRRPQSSEKREPTCAVTGQPGAGSQKGPKTSGTCLQHHVQTRPSGINSDAIKPSSRSVSVVLLRPPTDPDTPTWRRVADTSVEMQRQGSQGEPKLYGFGAPPQAFPISAHEDAAACIGGGLLRDRVQSAVQNAEHLCVWVHGPRGSGKSALTWGCTSATADDRGLAGHVARAVFQALDSQPSNNHEDLSASLLVTVQMLKIGVSTELLGDALAGADFDSRARIREQPLRGGFLVDTIPEAEVCNVEELLHAIKVGRDHFSSTGTYLSGRQRQEDCRAHGLCTIRVRKYGDESATRRSTLHILDLSGAELSHAGGNRKQVGKSTPKEDKTLKGVFRVMDTLGESSEYVFRDGRSAARHIPYRDCKVTRLLQECFGGAGSTVLVSCAGGCDFNSVFSACELAARHENMRFGTFVPDVFDRTKELKDIDGEAQELAEKLGFESQIHTMAARDIHLDMDASDELVLLRSLLERRGNIIAEDVWDDIRAKSRSAANSRAEVGRGHSTR